MGQLRELSGLVPDEEVRRAVTQELCADAHPLDPGWCEEIAERA